jgi:leucyl/phenylalanyl-tRNA--protein transferase
MKRLRWLALNDPPDCFPPLHEALEEPAGLLAGGGDLSPQRLLAAYARGIFPWYAPGQPVLWWSPDPREVLFPEEFHRSRSLRKTLRSGHFNVTYNQCFEDVISACSRTGEPGHGTWITPAMREAYVQLHRAGHAHSYEVRNPAGELVGGLYGVRVNSVFSGESMFSRESDASKVALAALVDACPGLGLTLIDCQMPSPHLRSLGSRALPRARFAALLQEPAPGSP